MANLRIERGTVDEYSGRNHNALHLYNRQQYDIFPGRRHERLWHRYYLCCVRRHQRKSCSFGHAESNNNLCGKQYQPDGYGRQHLHMEPGNKPKRKHRLGGNCHSGCEHDLHHNGRFGHMYGGDLGSGHG